MSDKKNFIVITGGGGGIGMACAKALKGEELFVTDYSQEIVDRMVATLKKEGHSVMGAPCDITDKEDVGRLKDEVAKHGTFKALVHTAGVSGTVKDLKKVYTIDLVGTELLVEAFEDLANEGSVAVLFSSMMAHAVPASEKYDHALTNPQAAGSFETVSQFVDGSSDKMYNFAKRGVQLLSIKHADGWGAKGARVVTISPGVIETPMGLKAAEEHPEQMAMIKKLTPLGRNGSPEDVAEVVRFLISDAARFITATDILVDGGVIHKIKNMG